MSHYTDPPQHIIIDLNLNIHGLQDVGQGQVLERLDRIDATLRNLIQGVRIMARELDQLEAEVTKNTEVDRGAITLLNGLAAQIAALKNDPAKLQALSDALRNSSADLAAAILANTPAEPA